MHILIKMLLLSNSYTCHTQPVMTNQIDTGNVIRQIRVQFNAINARGAALRKQKRELSTDFSSEGGSMDRFYDPAGKLQKIVCENYGAIGRTHEEYYIHNDSLFFAYTKEYIYNEPISVNMNPSIKKVTENRYYFYQDEIIQWLEDVQKKEPSGFAKMSREILGTWKRYVKIA
jgi:hypothetical protein